jgi:hypothetical protein
MRWSAHVHCCLCCVGGRIHQMGHRGAEERRRKECKGALCSNMPARLSRAATTPLCSHATIADCHHQDLRRCRHGQPAAGDGLRLPFCSRHQARAAGRLGRKRQFNCTGLQYVLCSLRVTSRTVIISSMPCRAFTFAHATRCLQLSFTGLTPLSRRIFPPLKSPACRPSTPSSLLHTRGWKKARISATFNGRSHQATERLSGSMVTCTGVDLEEGEVACGVFVGFMFCGVEYHVGCLECAALSRVLKSCVLHACTHPFAALTKTYFAAM